MLKSSGALHHWTNRLATSLQWLPIVCDCCTNTSVYLHFLFTPWRLRDLHWPDRMNLDRKLGGTLQELQTTVHYINKTSLQIEIKRDRKERERERDSLKTYTKTCALTLMFLWKLVSHSKIASLTTGYWIFRTLSGQWPIGRLVTISNCLMIFNMHNLHMRPPA